MWKDYSASYIKNNRASGVSIMVEYESYIGFVFL